MKLMLALLVLPAILRGCGGSGGGGAGTGPCEIDCTSVQASCPAVGSEATFLSAMADATAAIEDVGGAPAQWWGEVIASHIRADGKPSQDPTTEILGVPVYASGWAFKLSSGTHEVTFSAGPETSSVIGACYETGTVPAPPTVDALPTIDSDEAIAAAFPSGASTALYSLTIVPTWAGGTSGVWVVTDEATQQVVHVDGATGQVLP